LTRCQAQRARSNPTQTSLPPDRLGGWHRKALPAPRPACVFAAPRQGFAAPGFARPGLGAANRLRGSDCPTPGTRLQHHEEVGSTILAVQPGLQLKWSRPNLTAYQCPTWPADGPLTARSRPGYGPHTARFRYGYGSLAHWRLATSAGSTHVRDVVGQTGPGRKPAHRSRSTRFNSALDDCRIGSPPANGCRVLGGAVTVVRSISGVGIVR
jgi:hypothetical protein